MVQRSGIAVSAVAVSVIAMCVVGIARADPTARTEHTRALAAQVIAAARAASAAKMTVLLEAPLRYSLVTWDDEACNEKLGIKGTVTRSTLPAFAACLAKQDFAHVKVIVDDESFDEPGPSSYVRFKTAPTGRRLINAIEFGRTGEDVALSRLPGGSPPLKTAGGTSGSPGPGAVGPSGDFGSLTADEIDRVITARAGVFRACYQKELNHTPGIGGKLIIHFRIGGDGAVKYDSLGTAGGSTLRNDDVERCVLVNVGHLRFPAKGGGASVIYPFVFTAAGMTPTSTADQAVAGAVLVPATSDLPDNLDREMIFDGIDKLKPQVMSCAEKWPAKGQVKVSVTVGPDGHVTRVTVRTTPDANLGSCVAGVLQKATFARTWNGASFGYPYTF
jgi:hypothetical protein